MALGKYLLIATALFLLSGHGFVPPRPDLPYGAWFLGLLAPSYMEVWVESVDVVDRRGLVFEQVSGGTVAILTPANNSGNPRGWPARVGMGAGKYLHGIDLPEFIFVRWQSLVEPQTYHVKVSIPQWVREQMLPEHSAYCHADKAVIRGQYYNFITIGLAPGGIAKAWLAGPCLDPIEIGRFVGVVHKEGPSDGQSGGRYALPLSEESESYVDKFGVPYGSW